MKVGALGRGREAGSYLTTMLAVAACLTIPARAVGQEHVDPMAATVAERFTDIEESFIALADAMPAEKYGFKPTNGEFTNVRTFAEQVKHVACNNFAMFNEIEKKEPPKACGRGGPSPARTKAELMAYLRDSFAYADRVLRTMTPANALEPAGGPYGGESTRLGLTTLAVWHVSDHYGQLVMYLRMNGIVPPASRPVPTNAASAVGASVPESGGAKGAVKSESVSPPAEAAPAKATCRAEVLGSEPYEQRVTATALHCSKAPEQCASAHEESVGYTWPAEPASSAPRLALLQSVAPFLSPPVGDPGVRLVAGWLYEPGRWHMAMDYGIDGTKSFTVRAAAEGRVIFAGWDGFSGNTVIVSHDVGGEDDAYRTVYMHLRNGAAHDCAFSWSVSVSGAPQGSPMLAAYEAQLERTGCSENPTKRRLDPRFWGTDNDTLEPGLLGRQVTAGAVLGKAGDTGPGGFATAADPNVHLHVFYARRDQQDGAWVLFDPWGVYGVASCYPRGVSTGKTAEGFPSAWK